jgi:hypothetical protein
LSATAYQRNVCKTIAANRIASGESYVAGGVALTSLLSAPRLSSDIDVFHEAAEAVASSYLVDRSALEHAGYTVELRADRVTFIDCTVSMDEESVILQWVYDSAYRFFPLQTHPDFGLTMHPFDLATNKVLALVGRLVVRDWVDVLQCNASLQPLGYLAWASCGKDIGLSPTFIIDQAHRSGRYTQIEVDQLEYEGEKPDASEMAVRWKHMLTDAERIIDVLPAEEVGACVLDIDGNLLQSGPDELIKRLARNEVRYHHGSIRGAYPVIKSV